MTIASYSDLQTAVTNWTKRADLTSLIPDMITLAEKRINREIRTGDMETAYSGAIASGVIAVPSDFLAWKVVYIDGTPIAVMEVKPLDALLRDYPNRAADSKPKFIARNGTNFDFGPYPDSTYTVKGTYYKRLTAVSSSWNALATTNPDLYLAATLKEAFEYAKDLVKAVYWENKYVGIREEINKEAAGSQVSNGAIRMSPG